MRPAFSNAWFNSSPKPSTRTLFQNSLRNSGILFSANSRPCSLRAMPQ